MEHCSPPSLCCLTKLSCWPSTANHPHPSPHDPQDNGQQHDGERSQPQQHLQAHQTPRPSTDQQLQQPQQLQQLRSGELRNANGAVGGGGGAGLLSTAGSSNCEALLQLLPVLTGLDCGWWDQVERACVAIAQHLGAAHTWCVGPGGGGRGQQTVWLGVGQGGLRVNARNPWEGGRGRTL